MAHARVEKNETGGLCWGIFASRQSHSLNQSEVLLLSRLVCSFIDCLDGGRNHNAASYSRMPMMEAICLVFHST